MPKSNPRLPKFIIPTHYKLTIRPDMEAFTFTGQENISIKLEKNVKAITLHSKDLEITDAWWQVGKNRIDVLKTSYDSKAETATFHFAKNLTKGAGKLCLHFRGVINETLRGFYRSQYHHNGKEKHLASTQFEATDARRAFPSFDEPAQKAVFELSLIIPNHLTAISNTIESATPAGVEHDPGYKIVNFKPSPKMSTYLLAYVVGEFESVETKTKDGATVRVFTTAGKKHQAKFALDVAKRTLEFLNQYFAIKYPLPVLDLITIPNFSAGAMENWGAVTFRESALLVDEKHTAFANKQHVAEVIAHELVHQWFGNLVTMEWWTHLWLNESFASFMAYIVLDELFPEWKIWTRFVMHDHANALHLDSLKNTHPIEVEVHHPDQISEIFDAISYDKGASVLRMLRNYIGPENFRDGLRYYLKKHSYKNTSSVHLWEAFEKISKKPVRKFMKQWVSKPGYPLLTVVDSKIGSTQRKLQLTQSRFTLQPFADKTTWPIPVQFKTTKQTESELWVLDSKQKSITVSSDVEFVKANPDETGFYRTLYSPSLLAKLYEPVKNKELSIIDRYGIVRDLFAMVKSGRLPTSAFLEFLPAYQDEDSYIIWSEIVSGMNEIHNLASELPQLQKDLEIYFRQQLKAVAAKVGWEAEHKESQARGLLRSVILSTYGSFGDPVTIKKAQALFKSRKTKPIHPDLRSTVYYLSGLNANPKTHQELIKAYQAETLQEEQRRFARAFMSTPNKQLLAKALDFSLSKYVRSQDAPLLIIQPLLDSKTRDFAWTWLQKNWPTIYDRYHEDHLIVWPIKYLSEFTSLKKAKEIESFFKKHPVPAGKRTVQQTLEQIHLQAAWLKRDKKDIERCIKRQRAL
jgi:puromycin-sensitive aminopeptidase